MKGVCVDEMTFLFTSGLHESLKVAIVFEVTEVLQKSLICLTGLNLKLFQYREFIEISSKSSPSVVISDLSRKSRTKV